MGNPTRFLAINLISPEEGFLFHFFENPTWHHIWSEIIPEDAPNDLKHRLMYGPSYVWMEYDQQAEQYIQRRLRSPRVDYHDIRLHELNEYTRSAFEIPEFALILKYASVSQNSGIQMSDRFLHWILDDLTAHLEAFFSNDISRFDAIVLDYFL